MSYRAWVTGLATALSLLGLGGSAFASSPKVKESYVDRKLVMPKGTLRVDAGDRFPINDATYYDGTFKHRVLRGRADEQFLNPGISFGLVDNFEFGVVAPLRLSPSFRIQDPRIHALFQFAQGPDVQAGIAATLVLGFRDRTVLLTGVPVYIRFRNDIRLDTGGFLKLTFGPDSNVALVAPIQLVFQPLRPLFCGPEAGLEFHHMFDDGFDVRLPAGGFVGYTLTTSGGTLGDLYARLRAENLVHGLSEVSLMAGLEFFFEL